MKYPLLLFTLLSYQGAKYPEQVLELTDAQRWAGFYLLAFVTAFVWLRSFILKRLNNA